MNKKTLMRALTLLLAAVMLLSFAACGKDNGDGGQTNAGPNGPNIPGGEAAKTYTYNTYTSVSPANWNELTYRDDNDTQIMGYIQSSFFTFDFKFDENGLIVDSDYEVEFDAAAKLEDVTAKYAEAWGLDKDASGYAWAITLRDDLKWDDGTPIKAEDFVYTMQQQLDPLFQNYRADSFYKGGTIIVNAQEYVKQGQSGWFPADGPYATYSEDMDSIIVFSIGPATEARPAISSFRSWLEDDCGAPEDYPIENTAAFMLANGVGEAFTAELAVAMEGKTLAEIKADPAMNAAWEAVIKWWKTQPDEELDFFVTNYTYPELDFEKVGIFVGDNEHELVLVLAKAMPLLKDDGSLSYLAAYQMSSLPLVHKAKYEASKIPPAADVEGALWTTNYNTSVASTASWGPYKLETFQSGTQYTLVRNENWYGYNLPQNEGLYQTTNIVCDTISQWDSAWLKFKAGELAGIGINVTIADEYKNSDRAYFTPDDFVQSLQLQSNKEALKAREEEGINKTLLSYQDFRKALSLAIDRADFAAKTTTSSLAGFGLFNSMHYYDVANGSVYRDTDEAKKVLCDIYNVDYTQYDSLDAAVASITGYDPAAAKELVIKAYNEALANGDIKEGDKFKLTFGTAVINEDTSRAHKYLINAWTELFKGTPLEGKFEGEEKEFSDKWAEDFRAGDYDVCMGGWSGAAWDPGYFLLAYLSPDYMYSTAWDTSTVAMTFTMKGVAEDGGDITETMSLLEWYDCLNGSEGAKYDWSSNALEEAQRLQLIAALELEVLKVYYSVPVFNSFGASLISYKVDYITYEYNTFMGYGGMKYMTYNFDDASWAAEVAKYDGEIDYK